MACIMPGGTSGCVLPISAAGGGVTVAASLLTLTASLFAPAFVGEPAPSFVAAGTESFTAINAGVLTPTLPTGWQAGDIHVLLAVRSDNTAMTNLTGWTQVAGLSGDNTTAQRVEVWWRRAQSGDTDPTITFGASTIVRGARVFGVRGCVASGDPIHTSSRADNATPSNDVAIPDITPSIDGTYVLALYAFNDDPFGVTSQPPAPWATVLHVRSSSGTDMAFGCTHRAGPASGVGAGALTLTMVTGVFVPAVSVGIALALTPA
jgi:hypothetical protein